MRSRYMARTALFAALMGICGWISIPAPPFRYTLQNFAVFLALLTLGGKWGLRSVLLYLGLGAVGLPVFSGFRSGFGALMDVTGGFLWGFLAAAVVFRLLEHRNRGLALVLGTVSCYFCGVVWFMGFTGEWALIPGLIVCVVPYVLPDAVKLWLAWTLAKKLRRLPFHYS